jgi:hypothetical protein
MKGKSKKAKGKNKWGFFARSASSLFTFAFLLLPFIFTEGR